MDPLSKDERNELFLAIEESNLDPGECEYEPLSEDQQARIFHALSGSEFIIKGELSSGGWIFAVDTLTGDDPYYVKNEFKTIAELAASVKAWAENVWVWMETPNLWEISGKQGSGIPGQLSPDSANTPFDPDEQAAISAQLREIKGSVKKTFELTAEQSKQIDEKFEEAEKASRRMGRKDWGLLFGGAVFSLILSETITPGIAGHILMLVEHGIGHLFMGNPPPVRGVLSAGQD